MPTTPIYALPYPAASDPADVPTDMQELAVQIEAVVGRIQFAFVAAGEGTIVTTYVALTTAGPELTVAASGDYLVTIGATIDGGTNQNNFMSYQIGATAATDADCISHGGGARYSVCGVRRKTLTAGTVLSARYRNTAGTGTVTWRDRWMRLERIS